MVSPYRNLPARQYWKSAASRAGLALSELYVPRNRLRPEDLIATAGSCFAQHISRFLLRAGCKVLDVEPPPFGLDGALARRFGYGLYSARYGNIYCARQLLQLIRESLGQIQPQNLAWERQGRWHDALRPSVEPEGLDSPDEVIAHRADHMRRLRGMFEAADVLIFTLGLTEAWVRSSDGLVFPSAPGTLAGCYSPEAHAFKNFDVGEVVADLVEIRRLLQGLSPGLRIILSVSPVPLAATASGRHVLVANAYSKAVLRAAAGEACRRFEDLDYFPAYEIIATPVLGRDAYQDDHRTVTPEGVARVMSVFLSAHGLDDSCADDRTDASDRLLPASEEDDVICEEALLGAFSP